MLYKYAEVFQQQKNRCLAFFIYFSRDSATISTNLIKVVIIINNNKLIISRAFFFHLLIYFSLLQFLYFVSNKKKKKKKIDLICVYLKLCVFRANT